MRLRIGTGALIALAVLATAPSALQAERRDTAPSVTASHTAPAHAAQRAMGYLITAVEASSETIRMHVRRAEVSRVDSTQALIGGGRALVPAEAASLLRPNVRDRLHPMTRCRATRAICRSRTSNAAPSRGSQRRGTPTVPRASAAT